MDTSTITTLIKTLRTRGERLNQVAMQLEQARELLVNDTLPSGSHKTREPKRLSQDDGNKLTQMLMSGASARDIATTLGISRAAVYQWRDRHNIAALRRDAA